ncbi:MAG: CinA family protein [Brevundimonas sp.]|uniref:CinA family protein n=1 Tax=Brevundimonas sp. TaxID=1871086 RepID=UPI003919336E
MFPDDILTQAQAVCDAAGRAGLMVATAESCTGGLVAAALTALPGSSKMLDRGFVTYSNAAKADQLGVATELIEQHGAVSESVARAMAQGAVARSLADVAVAVTGIAGPGGSEHKPAGLVWFASQGPLGLRAEKREFGDIGRTEVRMASLRLALDLLKAQLDARA